MSDYAICKMVRSNPKDRAYGSSFSMIFDQTYKAVTGVMTIHIDVADGRVLETSWRCDPDHPDSYKVSKSEMRARVTKDDQAICVDNITLGKAIAIATSEVKQLVVEPSYRRYRHGMTTAITKCFRETRNVTME